VIASLNHPNICQLYDIGPNYLVMEYIEGVPLKGPLSVEEALRLAIQMAEALEAAHRKGIVHRDLKPSNVLVSKVGVKLLDFGLAKMRALTVTEEAPTQPITGEGTILGTLQYISPEQLQGMEADARSDIFAFGLTVYEMVTGRRTFEASSQASLIGAILHTDPPPVSSLVPVAPPALDRVIRQCLAKDPDSRWQSARDIAGELQWIAEAGSQAGVPAPIAARRRSRERLAWFVAAVLGIAAVGAATVAMRHLREIPPQQQAVRFRLDLPEGAEQNAFATPVLSPDGTKIIVVAGANGKTQLWIRSLDAPVMRPLPGTEGATQAVFSPDSRSVAFLIGGSLRRLDLAGGAIQTVCDSIGLGGGALAWSREGVILAPFAQGIQRAFASGGPPKPATELIRGEQSHLYPSFLPDGRHFLYYVYAGSTVGAVNVGSLDDGRFRKRLL
jgi:hypothetical protein